MLPQSMQIFFSSNFAISNSGEEKLVKLFTTTENITFKIPTCQGSTIHTLEIAGEIHCSVLVDFIKSLN